MGRLGRWVWVFLSLGFLLRLAIILRPFLWVDDLVLCDDTYLCWDIARRWAGGHPMTQDGIHFTNGFQPLWVFLLIPIYALFPNDPFLPGKIALVLLALFNVATGVFLFLLTKEVASRKGAFFALFLWMASPAVIVQGINGMETALAIMLMTITLWVYLSRVRDKPYSGRRYLGLGLLAGLTMLARLDQAFFVLALGLDVLWQKRKQALVPLALMGLGALAALSPWLALSWAYTHSLIPVSGKAVRFLSLAKLKLSGIKPGWIWHFKMLRNTMVQWANSPLPVISVVHVVAGWLSFSRRILYGGLAFLAGLGLWGLWRRTLGETRERAGRLLFFFLYAAGMLGLYSFYIYTSWYHARYQAPMALLMTVAYGLVYSWSPRWGRQLGWGMALALILPGLWKTQFEEPLPMGYYRIGTYVQKAFPAGTSIGAYQSGAMGYLARDKVITNLDGVVNEGALRAHQERRAFVYTREQGLEYLVDWDLNFNEMLFQFSAVFPTSRELARLGPVPGFQTWGETWVVYRVIPRQEEP